MNVRGTVGLGNQLHHDMFRMFILVHVAKELALRLGELFQLGCVLLLDLGADVHHLDQVLDHLESIVNLIDAAIMSIHLEFSNER